MSKTIVLTGASDGIGAVAAQDLARRGHRLFLVGRSRARTEAVAKACRAEGFFLADFEHLDQVRSLVADLRAAVSGIDVLANNAGGLFDGPVITADGFERTLQVNHLAGVLLTHGLLDKLLANGGAVVNTSSIGARLFGHVDLDDLNGWNKRAPNKAYGDSKLANVLFAKALHEKYHAQGLSTVSFHPGNIATSFAADTRSYFRWVYHTGFKTFLSKPAQGGAVLAHFVEGQPGTAWQSGEYYGNNRKPGRTNRQAYDPELVRAHWAASAQMLGISWPGDSEG
ncbi:MAG: SDR family NAD(P)-dependent oxidoreductase [Bifidobacteriaceae bacterium]|jgi:NAD(P)-dependent dehydrogenase (short-subunit alcohol dehydrogenase family)|nr:SDR family NAD(P)-dependent oxidoreductase [Bifidobacteriaceae bacterium]